MKPTLVTGGSQGLGALVVSRLQKAGLPVRVFSRRPGPGSDPHWFSGDLETGRGLAEALAGVGTVVHAASSAMDGAVVVDREGTARLLRVAQESGVGHLVYISIVGCDVIDYPLYRAKAEAEAMIEASGMPFTILRTTQFHSFLPRIVALGTSVPGLALRPAGWKFQTIDEEWVAEQLVACVQTGPQDRLPEVGGPRVFALAEIFGRLASVAAPGRLAVPVPLPGPLSKAFRTGRNLTASGTGPGPTVEAWLERFTETGGPR